MIPTLNFPCWKNLSMLHFMMANTLQPLPKPPLWWRDHQSYIHICVLQWFPFPFTDSSCGSSSACGSKSIFFACVRRFPLPIKNNLVDDDSICRDFMNASILLHTLMMNYGPLSRVAFSCEALRLLPYYRLHRPPLTPSKLEAYLQPVANAGRLPLKRNVINRVLR